MKRNSIISSLVVVLLLSIMAVPTFAQQGNPPRQMPFRDSELLEALDITVEELRERLDAGETWEEIYAEAGLEIPTVRDVIRYRGAIGFVQLADALDITVEEVQARLDAGETLEALHEEAGLEMPAIHAELNELLEALDLTPEELRERLQDGATMNDLYEEAGIEKPLIFREGPYAELADGLGITNEELTERIQEFFQGLYNEAGMEMPEGIFAGGFGNRPTQGGRPQGGGKSPFGQGVDRPFSK